MNTGFCKKRIKQTIVALIVFSAVFFSAVTVASAATATYRFLPSTGATIATGITTSYGACGANPTTATVTLLTTAPTSGCGSSSATSGSTGAFINLYYNTAYSTNTNVAGQWYFGRIQNTGGSAYTFTFNLIYAFANGTVVVLPGSGTVSIPGSTDTNYNISLTGITGTVPSGAKLGMRISKSGTLNTKIAWFGDSGGVGSVASGYFLVNEIPIGGSANTYNISGYITNKTSGAVLNGATVQTNTSLTTTTNAAGFYNFTGLSNGTYVINASLTGYITNSTTATINGADVTNANISLSRAVAGVNLTNISALSSTTTAGTNSTYILNLANNGTGTDTYTITVSNPNSASTAATNIASAMLAAGASQIFVLNVTNTATGTFMVNVIATSGNDPTKSGYVNTTTAVNPAPVKTILVNTNRYSVQTFNPAAAALSGYDADNSTFTFTGGALVLANGLPVSGENVFFEIRNASGGLKASGTVATASNGLALFSYSVWGVFTSDSDSNYGYWTVKAWLVSNTSISRSVVVNLNDQNYINGCSHGYCHHNQNDISSLTGGNTAPSPRSPYSDKFGSAPSARPSMAYGAMVVMGARACVICHPGYGNPVGSDDGHTQDYHSNYQCSDSACHGPETSSTSATPVGVTIPSCYNANCHPLSNKNITTFTTLANISGISNTSIYSATDSSYVIPWSVHNGSQYSNITGVPCWICHGPMHNITRPDPLNPQRDNITEDSQCTACHTTYNEHNSSNITSGGVNCTLCHSQDAHAIKVFSQNASYVTLNRNNPNPARGNCTNCHQNASFFPALKAQPMAGRYTGRNPPQLPVLMNHSNDPNAGTKWNQTPGYWNNSNQVTWCQYCHGSPLHNATALGRPSQFNGNNIVNSTISTSTNWCLSCHWQGYSSGSNTYNDTVSTFTGAGLPVPPEITGNITYGANQSNPSYFNHTSVNKDDSTCKGCHGSLTTSTQITGFQHNVATGVAGGPNCIQCHSLETGLNAPVGINFTAVNLSVHFSMNRQNATNQGYAPVIGACWACHDNDGNVTSGHPDKYKTPKICTDCHLANGTYYKQSVTWGLNVTVSEHYYSGDQIIAGNSSSNISSCFNCHENVSDMIVYNDVIDNYYDFSGNYGVGGNQSFFHYGKNRSDIRIGATENCSYCHQNTSTVFITAMLNPAYNSSIQNHSLNYNASNPTCTQCHNTGWIHDSTLTKPNLTLPNSSFCLGCHGDNGTGGTNYTNATTGIKSRHNNTLNCTDCHLNSSRDIHPMKYLQPNSSYNTSNSAAVDCTTCHQNSTFFASLNNVTVTQGLNPPQVAVPLNHSTDIYNGSLWNGTQQGYWINSSQLSACIYCHNLSALHNASGLGSITKVKGSNSLNQNLTTSTWCANCHYSVAPNYAGNQFSPQPPEVLNQNGLVPATSNDGTTFTNHSSFFSSGYNDNVCEACHNKNLSASATSLNFSHNVNVGSSGGPNCIQCHDITGIVAPANKRINATAMRLGVHQNLNLNATNTTAIDTINKACWACHGNGTQPEKHPVNYQYPNPCEYCHVNNNFNATLVYRHYPGSVFSGTVAYDSVNPNRTCVSCHNNSLIANQNITYGDYAAENITNATVSHYAVNRTFGESMPSAVTGILPDTRAATGTNFGCNKCHNAGAVGTDYGNARIISSSHNVMGSTGVSCQSSCHNSNPLVNITLHDRNIGLYVGTSGCFSAGCHVQPGTGERRPR
ncbi:MAG: carboxypeptidase-like regulatory domain-containing protein [Candidatus Methanoperedens sp.]|nr:carboxypeptidase-like regulatory domain-containing protein [Candidatus Methanoperedens sp.]